MGPFLLHFRSFLARRLINSLRMTGSLKKNFFVDFPATTVPIELPRSTGPFARFGLGCWSRLACAGYRAGTG